MEPKVGNAAKTRTDGVYVVLESIEVLVCQESREALLQVGLERAVHNTEAYAGFLYLQKTPAGVPAPFLSSDEAFEFALVVGAGAASVSVPLLPSPRQNLEALAAGTELIWELPRGQIPQPVTQAVAVGWRAGNTLLAYMILLGEKRKLKRNALQMLRTIGAVGGLQLERLRVSEQKQRADDALRESRRSLTDLLGNLPGMVYRCSNDRRWPMEFVSEGCLDLTGYAPAELLFGGITHFNALIHPDDREWVWDAVQAAVREDRRFQLVYRIRTRSGEEKWVWERGRAVAFSPQVTVLEGFITDITERQHAEERLRRFADQRTQLFEVSQTILSTLSVEEMIARILQALENLVPSDHTTFYRLDRAASVLRPLIAHGDVDLAEPNPWVLPWGQGIAGAVAQSGRAECVNNAHQDARSLYRPEACVEQEHLISVPLRAKGEILGVFNLGRCRGLPFTGDEFELVQLFVAHATVAVEQQQLMDRLAHQAHHDALTGLPNRVLFGDRFEQALAHARRDKRLVALLLIDLDQFKQVNDSLGHPVGDALLTSVARRLEGCLRRSDTLARMGGDEFAVIACDLDRPGQAVLAARRLLNALVDPFDLAGRQVFAGASIGVAVYPQDGEKTALLQRNADIALYRAKDAGRGVFRCFAPEMDAAVVERVELESRLRRAMTSEDLALFYQPQWDLDGNIVGLEALARWNDPELGPIPPSKFIPIAEESGLVVALGDRVLNEACRQASWWRREGLSFGKVAVNVSALQWARHDFVETVVQALERHDLAPRFLELELTESALMRDVEGTARRIAGIRALAVTVAIDDFGVGYSSLSYLRNLAIDTLKIDRSFVSDVGASDGGQPLIKAVIALARALKLNVIVEGVETRREFLALRRAGCRVVQGYLLAKPMPAEAVGRLLAARRPQTATLVP